MLTRDIARNKESATTWNFDGVHHWFKRRSTRERKPVIRYDDELIIKQILRVYHMKVSDSPF